MCAITGFYDPHKKPQQAAKLILKNMLDTMKHRGPDGSGDFESNGIALGHARLSIIGLDNGQQPIANEDKTIWMVFAGEIFEHIRLRKELQAKGHQFSTNSDGEVVLHLYEEHGLEFIKTLNGQFSFAIWDSKDHSLTLCRDHFGILPLFYTRVGNGLVFASEIKAILTYPGVEARIEPKAMSQIFTFWTTLAPYTPFKNIFEVQPGHTLRIDANGMQERRYWDMSFPDIDAEESQSEAFYVKELDQLLHDSVNLRKQADVPVGTYLSGGLDSSAITALATEANKIPFDSFSIRFEDSHLDEGDSQQAVASAFGLNNKHLMFSNDALAKMLHKVIYHTETPVMRMGMAPMMSLSALVRTNNYKAVMTGEGADELLLGYNIFRETKARLFCSKDPSSQMRPAIMTRLYPYLNTNKSVSDSMWSNFFSKEINSTNTPTFSHQLRWKNTVRAQRFFSEDFRSEIGAYNPIEDLSQNLPKRFNKWHALSKAQYLESSLFLSHYLLSSQGDRMAMANSVEARYPFLDYRIAELCNRIPVRMKMQGLNEKRLLKQVMQNKLPKAIVNRPKQPYRAPSAKPTSALIDSISESRVREAGFFDPKRTSLLINKCAGNNAISESDQMALNGVISTQLFHQIYLKSGVKQYV